MSGWNNYKFKEKLANIISTLGNAPLIAMFIFILLNYLFSEGIDFIFASISRISSWTADWFSAKSDTLIG